MPKWVYFLIGVGAAVIAFQRLGSIDHGFAFANALAHLSVGFQSVPGASLLQLDVPYAIIYGLQYSGQEVADGLGVLAFGIISSMGFYLSAKR